MTDLLATGLALLFGGMIGLSLGSLGGGGSILVVPALVYGLSMPPKQAVVHAFAIVGITSVAVAILHWRHGSVRFSSAMLFAITGSGGAFLGARASRVVSDGVLLVSLGVVMAVAGTMMYRSATVRDRSQREASPRTSHLCVSTGGKLLLPMVGFGVGLLTGFLGIGGGFLIVPALTLVAGMEVKESIGTSLIVIAVNCLAGLAAHGLGPIDWSLIAPFLVASLVTSVFAARFARTASSVKIKKLFACFVFVVGGLTLAGNALAAVPSP